jgi:DNA repair exonuclease SbcCD ATPase subunit
MEASKLLSRGGTMADEVEQVTEVQTVQESNTGRWVVIILAVLYVAASLFFLFNLKGRADELAKQESASNAQIADLSKRMQASEADSEALATQLGMTKKELAAKSEELQRQQRAADQRLSAQQKLQASQLSQVSGDVAGVKTDLGGAKSDISSTKTELAATEAKLQSTIGDLGVQSGLIAHTRDDLEVLKHKGDRNYFEFTLIKGAKPQAISTVSLQLKKTDPKRGKFTLNVSSDDRTIEKKDRNIAEPIQFYSGRDHMLFELVVWTVDKKQATGYLSTPKNAPAAVTPGE